MKRFYWMALASLSMMASPALADPRLDEVVYAPYIDDHVLGLETRWSQEFGSGDLQGARTFVTELEYGFNDRLSVALVGQVEREPGVGDRLTGAGLEGIAYLGRIPGVGIDAGAYLEYRKGANGEPDAGEAKLLLAKTAGRFQALANLIAERPFGAPKGEAFVSYGYAASATWRTWGRLRLGAEAFGDLGAEHGVLSGPQGAYVGPQLKWEGRIRPIPAHLEFDAGWLEPVGPAGREAASQARISFEVEKRF